MNPSVLSGGKLTANQAVVPAGTRKNVRVFDARRSTTRLESRITEFYIYYGFENIVGYSIGRYFRKQKLESTELQKSVQYC